MRVSDLNIEHLAFVMSEAESAGYGELTVRELHDIYENCKYNRKENTFMCEELIKAYIDDEIEEYLKN